MSARRVKSEAKGGKGGLRNMKYASPVQQRDGQEQGTMHSLDGAAFTLAGKGTLCLETGSSQNST